MIPVWDTSARLLRAHEFYAYFWALLPYDLDHEVLVYALLPCALPVVYFLSHAFYFFWVRESYDAFCVSSLAMAQEPG